MKKYFSSIILCIITGIVMAKIMFNQYDETKAVSSSINNAYFFQVGVFSNEENMNKEVSKYDSYIYVKEEDKYYVYIGITKDNKDKLKQYFDSYEYETYIKEIEINEDFALKLQEFDNQLKVASNEEIKNVNNQILKTYEELNHE